MHGNARIGSRHPHQGRIVQTGAFEPPRQHLGAHIARQLHLDARYRRSAARGVALPIRPPRNQTTSVVCRRSVVAPPRAARRALPLSPRRADPVCTGHAGRVQGAQRQRCGVVSRILHVARKTTHCDLEEDPSRPRMVFMFLKPNLTQKINPSALTKNK